MLLYEVKRGGLQTGELCCNHEAQGWQCRVADCFAAGRTGALHEIDHTPKLFQNGQGIGVAITKPWPQSNRKFVERTETVTPVLSKGMAERFQNLLLLLEANPTIST